MPFKRLYTCSFVLLAIPVSAVAGGPVIMLDYDSVMDRVRPNPGNDLRAHFHIELQLSGSSGITQSYTLSSGSHTQNAITSGNLGRQLGSGVWHVISSQKLQHTYNMPQSVRTLTITMRKNDKCELNVVDHLKPGYTEYMFRAQWTEWESYSRYENINETCAVINNQ